MTPRYLIVQLADIGDLILSTPALAALRQSQPEAHLTLLTTTHSAPVIPPELVNEVITLDRRALTGATAFYRPVNLRKILNLRAGRYDAVLFFHHFTIRAGTLKFALIGYASGAARRIGLENGNGWFLTERLEDGGFGAKHQAQYWLDLVGVLGAETAPRGAEVRLAASYQLPATSPRKVPSEQPVQSGESSTEYSALNTESRQSNLEKANPAPTDGSPRIIIHAGGGGLSRARRWSPEKFAAVADALVESHQAQIVLVGGHDDEAAAVKAAMQSSVIDLTGQTTLPELAGLLSQADCFIGAESGVMHLAAASGTPVAAIFGPGNAAAWGPWQPDGKVHLFRSGVECSPCSYVGHGIGLREGCAARTCLKIVTVAQVVNTVRGILAASDQRPATGQPQVRSEEPVQLVSEVSPITILGLPIHPITYAEWLDQIGDWVRKGGGARHVCTLNPEFVMIARRDPNFWNILQRATLCVPDGVGLLWAARRQGTPLPERVTGSDGVPIIAQRAAQHGWRLYLLGAGPGIAQRTADILQARFPGLPIAGIYEGSPAPEDEDAIVERINASGADILFVAYGAPEQDKWIARNLPRLKVTMAMGVGGAFDFIAGVVPRAPVWMQRMGIEWLYRLYLQPWRIKRMMRLPRFVLAVLLSKRVTHPKG